MVKGPTKSETSFLMRTVRLVITLGTTRALDASSLLEWNWRRKARCEKEIAARSTGEKNLAVETVTQMYRRK